MLSNFTKKGLLPAGFHIATWGEFIEKFGFNDPRLKLLDGLKKGLDLLRNYGCHEVCIDGSYATAKSLPNDIDVAYDNTWMNWNKFIKEQPEFNDVKN